MTCIEFKEWLIDRDFAEAGNTSAARSHMQNCPECRKLYELDEELEGLIRQEMVHVEEPRSLLKKVEAGINRSAPQKVVTFPWKLVPALAVAALLVLFLVPFQSRHGGDGFYSFEELGAVALQDHISTEAMAFAASEVADVSAWYEARMGHAISLPDMASRGFSLVGGRICKLGNCDAAYITYRRNNKKASLFILPADDFKMAMEPGRSYTLTMNGNEFEFWQAQGQLHTLII
ncbi:MAG: hypothetical protein ABFS09_07595 [Thermodesulfobacteriota bacterium]